LLSRLVQQEGKNIRWTLIAKSLHGRKGKQCRERWYNKLDPSIKKKCWTDEEDQLIINLHQINGNKWAEIAKALPGRPSNTVKNRWYSYLRKRKSEEENTPVQSNKKKSIHHLEKSSGGTYPGVSSGKRERSPMFQTFRGRSGKAQLLSHSPEISPARNTSSSAPVQSLPFSQISGSHMYSSQDLQY